MTVHVDPGIEVLRALATLHRLLLPDSVISRLGATYARSFYRYAARSSTEAVFAAIGNDGAVLGGAVLTLRPADLQRRLARSTVLVPCLLVRPLGGIRILLASLRGSVELPVDRATPEVLAIFAAAQHQGRGVGAALLRGVEDFLRKRGLEAYYVRTEDRPENRAIPFYEREGFASIGRLEAHGLCFRVMLKRFAVRETDHTAARPPWVCSSTVTTSPKLGETLTRSRYSALHRG
jgi:GNAT superfamily N-acetyltransferase